MSGFRYDSLRMVPDDVTAVLDSDGDRLEKGPGDGWVFTSGVLYGCPAQGGSGPFTVIDRGNSQLVEELARVKKALADLEEQISKAETSTPVSGENSMYLNNVPEDVYTVIDADDGQPIYRLAAGGWVWGSNPGPDVYCAGEKVTHESDHFVYWED